MNLFLTAKIGGLALWPKSGNKMMQLLIVACGGSKKGFSAHMNSYYLLNFF
jgi:hypothetical protein